MIDISISYNRYKFIGFEFLTWVWFVIDSDPVLLGKIDSDLVSLDIGNRLVLENRKNETVETITIKGDDPGLEEGLTALKKGALVTEMNLLYKTAEHEWRFTVKGESLNVSGLKVPETGSIETADDIDGAIIEKADLCDRAIGLIHDLFVRFIKIRVSDSWNAATLKKIRKWIDR
jgi:hypothetical protein